MRSVLIQPNALAQALDDPRLRLFDCRFRLADPEAGRALWSEGHIPGALHADLDHDLTGTVTASTGRHPLPDPGDFRDWCARHGIDESRRVVCYDDAGGSFAARLWWLLAMWLGHPSVQVLDGGLQEWVAQGYRLTTAVPPMPPNTVWAPQPGSERLVTTTELEAPEPGRIIVDARDEDRYAGATEPIDPVAGHIPGAVNRPFPENLEGGLRWRSPGEIRERFDGLIGDGEGSRIVHMCGSGVTACHNVLAMEYAGLTGSRLYAGSWSEWVSDPARAVETGHRSDSGH